MFTKKAVLFSVCAVVLSSVFLLCASCRAQQSSEEAFQNAILYSQKEEYDLAVKEINKEATVTVVRITERTTFSDPSVPSLP